MKWIPVLFVIFISNITIAADVYDFRSGTVQRDKIVNTANSQFDSTLIRNAKSALRNNMLFNRDKVQFRKMRVVTNKNSKVTCGEFNSTNISGKHVGFNKFAHGNKGLIIIKKTRNKSGIDELDNAFEADYNQQIKKFKSLGCA